MKIYRWICLATRAAREARAWRQREGSAGRERRREGTEMKDKERTTNGAGDATSKLGKLSPSARPTLRRLHPSPVSLFARSGLACACRRSPESPFSYAAKAAQRSCVRSFVRLPISPSSSPHHPLSLSALPSPPFPLLSEKDTSPAPSRPRIRHPTDRPTLTSPPLA